MRVSRLLCAGLSATVLGAAALSGCASSGGAVGAGATGAHSASPTPRGILSTTPGRPTPSITPVAPAVGATVTVTGTVIQGAEPSCLILRSDRGEFELLSGKDGVHAGDRVTATGHVVRVMSHCMQGEPFQVDHLTVG